MKTALQLLQSKPPGIYSVAPTASVFEAIKLFAEKGIGAALVMDGERLAGIISERDYARKVILKGKSSHDTPVREIMSAPVIAVAPQQTNEECMRVMTDKRIRHLPVVEAGKVLGVLSIGDLVKDMIAEQKELIAQLENYIMGNG
jgi:CBS domain-containing protein